MNDFSQHYDELFDYVYRYLLIRLQNPQAAEDVTSNTFLMALENQHKYNSKKGSWRQWITGIAKNCLLMHWKKEKITLSLETIENMEIFTTLISNSSQERDATLTLETFLDSLEPALRTLLALRYVDDLTYKEIANITRKTPGAIRKTFSRLHHNLSERFDANDFTSY